MDSEQKPALKARLQASTRELLARARAILSNPKLEPAQLAQWATARVQNRGMDFYINVAGIVLSTYFLADLTALLAGRFVPDAPPPYRGGFSSGLSERRARPLESYNVIFSRNLFNSRGLIPGEEAPQGQDLGGPPIKTTLPFNLIGTLILRDELKSIATLEDKSASLVYPVRIQDEIPGKIRILTIEPRKVVFLNLGSGRREYVDLPEESATNPRINLGTTSARSATSGIEQISSTAFSIARSEVDKALGDLNSILTQARAVPNFENGLPAGYKLFQIVPGSIYEKLGLRNGDTITGLNGDPVNDPGKAFEALGSLKTASHLELQIKRDGKVSSFSYDIR